MNPARGGVEWRHFKNEFVVNGGVMGSRIGFNKEFNVGDGGRWGRGWVLIRNLLSMVGWWVLFVNGGRF